jgi:hypothetical protein
VLTDFVVFITERSHGCITVKLGDFGIATHDEDGTQTYVGTADYLAPVSELLVLSALTHLLTTPITGAAFQPPWRAENNRF